MRTSFVTVAGVLALGLLAGCTTKDVDPPSIAGPSTLARAISMTANRDTLFQNGVDFVDITITSTSPTGQSQAIPLRAEIMVDGVVQDFGTLSTKSPVTPATIRYTAPNASPIAAGQVQQVVTVAVTPVDSGDFRAEVARQVQLRLVPQGVILPTNPDLKADFSVAPASPPAFTPATFDASASTSTGGTACLSACSYAWNFGDGTTGSGMVTSHQYRTVGLFQAQLTVTDVRGAQATLVKSITVSAATPPSGVSITVSPSGGATVSQDLFFTAQAVAAPGRTIARYDWNFGDGESSSGSTTTHRYRVTGSFVVSLVVTDDVGAEGRASTTITVGTGTPTGALAFLPSAPRVGQAVSFNASGITPAVGATIVSYLFNYGDGEPAETGTVPFQSHVYARAGSFIATVTATDSLGRTITVAATVPVVP